jgi:hypothetical protein
MRLLVFEKKHGNEYWLIQFYINSSRDKSFQIKTLFSTTQIGMQMDVSISTSLKT